MIAMNEVHNKLYIPILNSPTRVLRLTNGEHIRDLIFRVLATENYDPAHEQWKFPPGKVVRCERQNKEGYEILIAVEEIK
jgi:hypothetical protein